MKNTLQFKIAKFLRIGVIISGLVMTLGWILSFKAEAEPFSSLRNYQQIDFFLQFQLAFMDQNWGRMISYCGLILLISLPVFRVFLSVILFMKQKEYMMSAIGITVFVGLLVSFSLGIEL